MKTILLKCDGRRVTGLRTAMARQAGDEIKNSARTCYASRVTRHSRAFTIVELLVVIAIIGILAGMILPALTKARVAAQKAQARKEEADIVGAIQQYDSVYGRFPVSNAAQGQAAANAQSGKNPDVTYGGEFKQTDGAPITIGTLLGGVGGVVLTNAEVMGILMDLTNCPNGNPTANVGYQKNPQQTIFLNPKMVDTNTTWSGVGQDLMYRDPWGNPYVITMDLNYDEQCRDAFYSLQKVSQNPPLPAPYVQTGFDGLTNPNATAGSQDEKDSYQYHGKVMVWSAGPDGKIEPTGPANVDVNKDNVVYWK